MKNKYLENYYAKKPWMKTYLHIVGRCIYNKEGEYFKKGIKNFLNTQDLKYLWFRDKAYSLKQPSIDRIDADGDYTLENCQYIEYSINVGKRRSNKKNDT